MPPTQTQTWTDPDKYVTLTLTGDAVSIAVTRAGFTRDPQLLAQLIHELGAELPDSLADAGTETDQALADSADTLDALGRELSTGGWAAFDKAMRARLGLDPAPSPLEPDPETDASLSGQFNAVLGGIRGAATRPAERAPEPRYYEAATPEGDLAVTTSTERVIAGVRIGPDARYRGVEGLGTALTGLVAEARSKLAEQSEALLRERLPEPLTQIMDTAPAHAEQAGANATTLMEQAARMTEAVKRKADGA